MMPSSRLRAAAELLREVASIGGPREYPAPWVGVTNHHDGGYNISEVTCHEDGSGLVADDLDAGVAAYIAMMSPPVALALADWLREEAAKADERDPYFFPPPALALADAILGTPTTDTTTNEGRDE